MALGPGSRWKGNRYRRDYKSLLREASFGQMSENLFPSVFLFPSQSFTHCSSLYGGWKNQPRSSKNPRVSGFISPLLESFPMGNDLPAKVERTLLSLCACDSAHSGVGGMCALCRQPVSPKLPPVFKSENMLWNTQEVEGDIMSATYRVAPPQIVAHLEKEPCFPLLCREFWFLNLILFIGLWSTHALSSLSRPEWGLFLKQISTSSFLPCSSPSLPPHLSPSQFQCLPGFSLQRSFSLLCQDDIC